MNEIKKLVEMLMEARIPFQACNCWDKSLQVRYPSQQHCVCDVVCHRGSYGYEKGLLEIMGLVDFDEVEGYLNAEEVFERIDKDWEKRKANIDVFNR